MFYLRIAVGLIFVWGGLRKFLEPSPFAAALEAAAWLPASSARLLLIALPCLELALGMALLVGWKVRPAAICSFVLLAVFSGFLAIELARGQTECGCFGGLRGPAAALEKGATPLLRNSLLLLVTGWLSRKCGRPDRWSIDYWLCPPEPGGQGRQPLDVDET